MESLRLSNKCSRLIIWMFPHKKHFEHFLWSVTRMECFDLTHSRRRHELTLNTGETFSSSSVWLPPCWTLMSTCEIRAPQTHVTLSLSPSYFPFVLLSFKTPGIPWVLTLSAWVDWRLLELFVCVAATSVFIFMSTMCMGAFQEMIFKKTWNNGKVLSALLT